jgi:two-component system sensor histidine kinase DegS
LLDNKIELEKEINNIQVELKQNQEFLKIIESNEDSSFESFTPREINSNNKQKISSLNEDSSSLISALENAKQKLSIVDARMAELSDVLKVARSLEQSETTVNTKDNRIAILDAQETERQRISRELHDSTVQDLTSLVYKTELCSKLIDIDPVRCKLELMTLSQTLRGIIEDIRQLIYNLRPMAFDDIGLDVTIERALDKLENSETKKIDFNVVGESYKILPVVGITLLRIVQEACSNAIRHAECTRIKVSLIYSDKSVSLIVEDDGCGFDSDNINYEDRQDNSGFGLSIMRERVFLLSGKIAIDSKINEGTKIIVEVPVNHI